MRRFRVLASLLCLFLPALIGSLARGQIAASFRITGTVVNSNDGAPVPNCHLIPIPIEPGNPGNRSAASQDGVDTDAHGHFSIQLPAGGSWSLMARARGYHSQAYDQHEGFSSAVVLTQAAPSIDLLYRITPDATITGYVLDEANEPVRHAQVSMHAVLPPGVDGSQPSRIRASATTDDRGHYELAGLDPGDYRLSVQAQPWYATTGQPARQSRVGIPPPPPLDPALDVVYPVTWFPGGTDPAAAATIALQGGETRQADFQLQPMPSVHLHIATAEQNPTQSEGIRRQIRYPQIEAVSPGRGTNAFSTTVGAPGQIDIGGLSPGLYRVQFPEEAGQPAHSSLIQITPGSARTLDLASAASTATVNLKIDGADADSAHVTFVDADNRQNVFFSNSVRGAGGFQRRQPVRLEGNPSASGTIEMPPGRYLLYQSSANTFVTGITLGGKDSEGRMVSIPAGESSLTLHLATGRASLTGMVTFQGKPSVGAMVLLVPITVDDPGSITEVRRDQSNTDGSFDIPGVIPGKYILIALDHGWHIRWNDPSTLRRYLAHGIPLDLRSSASMKQDIDAQAP